jgi:hypothetical protein
MTIEDHLEIWMNGSIMTEVVETFEVKNAKLVPSTDFNDNCIMASDGSRGGWSYSLVETNRKFWEGAYVYPNCHSCLDTYLCYKYEESASDNVGSGDLVIKCQDPCAYKYNYYPDAYPYVVAEWLDTMNVNWTNTTGGVGVCNSPSDFGDYTKGINWKLWTKNECLNQTSFETYKQLEWLSSYLNYGGGLPDPLAYGCKAEMYLPYTCECRNVNCNIPYIPHFNWIPFDKQFDLLTCPTYDCNTSSCWNGQVGGSGTLRFGCDCTTQEGIDGPGKYKKYEARYRNVSTSFSIP